ncbi:hypothetical protein Taro_017506 [Colocasia esculenta]|uniref:Uncharacterized protein n=1 Tax=Colocasia esculenta TaxID=4460 RepID=A0A843UW95_COLES|nr:hypothetical protein [Colocasia esculenta]
MDRYLLLPLFKRSCHPCPSTLPLPPAVVVHDLVTYSTAEIVLSTSSVAFASTPEALFCAAVKNLDDEEETKHLCDPHGAATRLHLFQIDILGYSSLLAAIRGTAGVFHLASPCIVDHIRDPKGWCQFGGELLDVEVKGAVNVLRVAKECGEKAACKFTEENGLDVIVVNPGTVMGPVLLPVVNANMGMLVRLLQGDLELVNLPAPSCRRCHTRFLGFPIVTYPEGYPSKQDTTNNEKCNNREQGKMKVNFEGHDLHEQEA